MATYKAFQVTGQREFALVEREVVEPAAGEARFRVALDIAGADR